MTNDIEDQDLSIQKSETHEHEIKYKNLQVLPTIIEATDTDLQVPLAASKAEEGNVDTINISSSAEKDDDREESIEESIEDDVTVELPDFDWGDFERKFTEAIQQVDKEESLILDQFDQLMEMFFIWAQTGSSHETERAVKRLKTRERYVQLSEASLEKKKGHYMQVVSAFKIALDLLRN